MNIEESSNSMVKQEAMQCFQCHTQIPLLLRPIPVSRDFHGVTSLWDIYVLSAWFTYTKCHEHCGIQNLLENL